MLLSQRSVRRPLWALCLGVQAFASAPALAVSPVQAVAHVGGYSVTKTRYSVTLPQAVVPGDGIVVFGYWQTTGFAPVVEDSQGNSYQALSLAANSSQDSAMAQLFFAPAARGGPLTVSLLFGPCMDSTVGLAVMEYATAGRALRLAAEGAQGGPVSTPSMTTPTIAVGAGALIVAGFVDFEQSDLSAGIAPDAGWKEEAHDSFGFVEDRVAPAAGAYFGAAQLPFADDRWVAAIAAFDLGSVPDGGHLAQDGGVSPTVGSAEGVYRVQSTQGFTVGVPEYSVTLPLDAGIGNTLVVFAYFDHDAFDVRVQDSAGDLYRPIPRALNPYNHADGQLFYAAGIDAGPQTITVFQGNDAGHIGVSVMEYAGLASESTLETSAGGTPSDAGLLAATPAVEAARAGDLLVAGFMNPEGTGMISPLGGTASASCSSAYYALVEDRVLSQSGAAVPSAQMPRNDLGWVATAAVFRAKQPPLAVGCDCDTGPGSVRSDLGVLVIVVLALRRLSRNAPIG